MLKIYNTLSRDLEEFVPGQPGKVGMYTCGPTVYDYMHIGNLRTATLMEVVKRGLKYLGYEVTSVMNITDVDDKIENRAKQLQISVDELTAKYEQIYVSHLAEMNISADIYPRASALIKEQQELVEELLQKGYAYIIPEDGVYFDINKDADYGKLGNTFHSDKAKSRIGAVEGKRNPEDFALWKLPAKGEERQKLWDSPWGKGFPGWHIECSAMSMKFLSHAFDGEHFDPNSFRTIDIHLGGEDIRDVHHENEVAQSESATDQQFVKYWMHGAMLNIESDKMSKSLGNFITLEQVKEQGLEPLALRYFYYTAHYRKPQNFTWEALGAAQTALNKLRAKLEEWQRSLRPEAPLAPAADSALRQKFIETLEADFNTPEALAVVWELTKSDLDAETKLKTLLDFDQVLGLQLESWLSNPHRSVVAEIPADAQVLLDQRAQARADKNWAESDRLRDELKDKFNLTVKDRAEGQEVV